MVFLGEVLEQRDLGLELLSGGPHALERTVAGAHNSDALESWRFIGPDWIMLTLGLQLRRNPQAQRSLVRGLVDRQACALGFGVGVAFKQVPRALLQEADRLSFPVFRIPYETPYRKIVGFVNRALFSVDYSLLQRSLSMQNHLIDALRAQQPVSALLGRLGELLKSSVVLLDKEGELVAGCADVPIEAIWTEILRRPDELHRTTVHGHEVVNMPLGRQDNPTGWLVTVSPSEALPRELVLSVVQSAERLLDAVSLGRRAVAAEERVARAELLASALDDASGTAAGELQPRLRRFGFDNVPRRVVVLDAPHGDLESLRHTLEQSFSREAVPYLTVIRPPHLVILVGADRDRISAWLSQSPVRDDRVAVGIGREVDARVTIAQSYRESLISLRHRVGPVRFFEDLGLATWLINSVPADELARKLDDLVLPLRAKGDLIETLSAYLTSGLSIQATAEALNLHGNTVRYRLTKAEHALGRSLTDMATIVDLHIALVAMDVTGPIRPQKLTASP